MSSLPWLVPLPPRVHLPSSTIPTVSGAWDSWRLVLVLKTQAKKAFSIQPCPLSPRRPIFSLLLRCSGKPSCCFWHPLPDSVLGFHGLIPACSDCVPDSLSLFPSPVWFIFVCEFWYLSWHFYQLTGCWYGLLWSSEGIIFELQPAFFDPPLVQDVHDSCKHHQCQSWAHQCTLPVLSHKSARLFLSPLALSSWPVLPGEPLSLHGSTPAIWAISPQLLDPKAVVLQLHTNLLMFTLHAACINTDFSALKQLQDEREAVTSMK